LRYRTFYTIYAHSTEGDTAAALAEFALSESSCCCYIGSDKAVRSAKAAGAGRSQTSQTSSAAWTCWCRTYHYWRHSAHVWRHAYWRRPSRGGGAPWRHWPLDQESRGSLSTPN